MFKKIWKKYFFFNNKNPLCFLMLGIHNSARALQSGQILREKISNKLKITFFFFKQSDNVEGIFFWQKNAIILVLPIEEISLWPELSSPVRFRFQGGWYERYGRRTDGRMDKNPIL